MISNFQVFVNNFFKFFIKQGYKDSNLEMTESESVALPFGDSAKINIANYITKQKNVKQKTKII